MIFHIYIALSLYIYIYMYIFVFGDMFVFETMSVFDNISSAQAPALASEPTSGEPAARTYIAACELPCSASVGSRAAGNHLCHTS